MGQKPSSIEELSETLSLCEFKDGGAKGFWLYDTTRGMNLAMRAESKSDALLDALEYYQDRLATVEKEHSELLAKVNHFLSQFNEEYYVE